MLKSIVLFGVVLAGHAFNSMAQTSAKQDILVLEKFRADFTNSLIIEKSSVESYYDQRVRLMPPFQKTVLDKENALLYYQAFRSRFDVLSYMRKELEILDLGKQILETGTFLITVRLKKDGQEYSLAGKYIDIWQKHNEGKLLLITQAWNFDEYNERFHEQLRFDSVPGVHAAMLPNVPVTDAISFELAALNRLLDETVTDHDSATWSLYYAGDGMLLPNYHAICHGKKAIDSYIGDHIDELPIFEELDIRNDRIDYLGKYIIEYASHIASWKNGSSSGVNMGKNIRIWRREPDHSLKLFRSISMYD
jgi:ketosteroid isomerase-like protein